MTQVCVYTLGDHEIIRGALNAIAMLFDPAQDKLTGTSGSLGLGQFAAFGLLISFATIVVSGVLHQKMEFHHLIIGMVMYVALFVPKTSVVIQDMSNGQTAVVDNVPIGIAYPGGIISTFTHSVAIAIESTMKTASSEYLPQTDVGFAGPLQLMLAARNAANAGDPLFAKNYSYLMEDCVRPLADPSKVAYLTDLNDILTEVGGGTTASLGGFGANAASKGTMYFTSANPAGVLTPCPTAAAWLQTEYQNLYNVNTNIPGNTSLNTIEAHMNPSMLRKPTATSAMDKFTMSDLTSSVTTIAGMGADAQKIITMLVMGDLAYNTYNCGQNDSPNYASCQANMSQNMESYKMEAATSASMFQKTMIPSMNVFMFFFYAFSPIIAILVAMSGMRGVVQIVPKYMLFGVWTQTWIPAAAIINYFMQMQTQEAVRNQIMSSDGIPLANTMALYQTLSTKLSAASEMLAMAPMVTLALITGSMFALAQLAGRKDHNDVSMVAPKAVSTAAATEVGAMHQVAPGLVDSGNATTKDWLGTSKVGAGTRFSYSVDSGMLNEASKSIAAGKKQALADEQSWMTNSNMAYGANFAAGLRDSVGHKDATHFAESDRDVHSFGQNMAKQIQARMSKQGISTLGVSTEALGKALAAGYLRSRGLKQTGAEATKTINDTTRGFLQSMPSSGIDYSVNSVFSKALDETVNSGLTEQTAKEQSVGTQLSDEHTKAHESSLDNRYSKDFRQELSKRQAETKSRISSFDEQAKEVDKLTSAAKSTSTFDDKWLGKLYNDNAGFRAAIDERVHAAGVTDKELNAAIAATPHHVGKGEETARRGTASMQLLQDHKDQSRDVPLMALKAVSGANDFDQFSLGTGGAQGVRGSIASLFREVGKPGLTDAQVKESQGVVVKAEAAAGVAGTETAKVPGQLNKTKGSIEGTDISKKHETFLEKASQLASNPEGREFLHKLFTGAPLDADLVKKQMADWKKDGPGFIEQAKEFVSENPAMASGGIASAVITAGFGWMGFKGTKAAIDGMGKAVAGTPALLKAAPAPTGAIAKAATAVGTRLPQIAMAAAAYEAGSWALNNSGDPATEHRAPNMADILKLGEQVQASMARFGDSLRKDQ